MEFKEFKKKFQDHFKEMIQEQDTLFTVEVNKDKIWNLYLDSFPPGTNEIFRERREFDCNCCRYFIKSYGNIVVIKDDEVETLWDFQTGDSKYQKVVNALSQYLKSKPIENQFVTQEPRLGVAFNHEKHEGAPVFRWDHFSLILLNRFVYDKISSTGTKLCEFRANKEVFKRSLEEISKDAIETVLELIAQKSLYKGEEWRKILEKFLTIHTEYYLPLQSNGKRDNFCWQQSAKLGPVISRIRNHSIGVLLTDISNGMDLNEAVSRYERIVAPTNYKRPKAIFTKKMIEQAQQTITKLGYLDSLGRRFATIDDITADVIRFANRNVSRMTQNDPFFDLQKEAVIKTKSFGKVEEVSIDQFMKEILPRINYMEVLFEKRHEPNLVSLIAPQDLQSESMFRWNNGFSWAYKGNITDSMKERVKAAGGRVEGVLRFSIQWNENGNNQNDFDAHCIEPNGNHIYYPNVQRIHNSSGKLDVDFILPKVDEIAVENIIWTDASKIPEGIYKLFVHVYSYRNGKSGFSAEVEFDNEIYSFDYGKDVRQNEKIHVADVSFSKKDGFKIVKSMPTSISQRTLWNIATNQFHPVTLFLLSPNCWNEQEVGHKHYMFMLDQCRSDERPNGFFNEFLKQDLLEHKRVFEALGSKMRVSPSENQLSGLGFSSTKRGSIICKLKGNFTRTIKLTF